MCKTPLWTTLLMISSNNKWIKLLLLIKCNSWKSQTIVLQASQILKVQAYLIMRCAKIFRSRMIEKIKQHAMLAIVPRITMEATIIVQLLLIRRAHSLKMLRNLHSLNKIVILTSTDKVVKWKSSLMMKMAICMKEKCKITKSMDLENKSSQMEVSTKASGIMVKWKAKASLC